MTVQAFGSFDEMIAAQEAAHDAAVASLAPEQAAITYGSTWVRFDHLIDDEVVIFGEARSRESILAAIRAELDETPKEIAEAIADHDANQARGYVFCDAYSTWVSDGEVGDVHQANVWPISRETFEAVRDAGWEWADLGSVEASAEIAAAFNAWRTHVLRTLGEATS